MVKKNKSPKIKNSLARRSLIATFGSLDFNTLIFISILLMSLGWLGDIALAQWQSAFIEGEFWLRNLPLVIFPLLFLFTLFLAKRARQDVQIQPSLCEVEHIKSLIIVFSNFNKYIDDLNLHLEQIRSLTLENSAELNACIAKPDEKSVGNFGAIIKAIALQIHSLEEVVLLTSKESEKDVNLLNQVLEIYFPTHRFKVNTQKTLLPFSNTVHTPLDFNDIEQVGYVLHEVFSAMEDKYNDEEVLLDITGGTKITAIAGTIIATANGRKLQLSHQDTHEKQVITLGLNEV